MINKASGIAGLAALMLLIVPLTAFAGHDHDDGDEQGQQSWHDNGLHKGWYKHHHHHEDEAEPEAEPQPYPGRRVCDADGDDCRIVAPEPQWHPRWDNRYVCDADGDQCHWTNGAAADYWREDGGYDYGAPFSWYEAEPPTTYSLVQRRNWLISRRRRAMVTIKLMRERGDSRGAGRLAKAVQTLNGEINALDRELGWVY
jgi:hypothetical protein